MGSPRDPRRCPLGPVARWPGGLVGPVGARTSFRGWVEWSLGRGSPEEGVLGASVPVKGSGPPKCSRVVDDWDEGGWQGSAGSGLSRLFWEKGKAGPSAEVRQAGLGADLGLESGRPGVRSPPAQVLAGCVVWAFRRCPGTLVLLAA